MKVNPRNLVHLTRGLLLRRRTPLFVTLRITTRCNMNCAYCDTRAHPCPEMTTEQILAMIDEFRSLGMVKLGLTGGEPLLRRGIGRIIDHASSQGVVVTLNTNGLLVPRMVGQLGGLDKLFISLDGLPATHDLNRAPGSFDVAWRAIEAAQAAGIDVWTLTVLTRHNLAEIPGLVSRLAPRGIRMLFQPVEAWDLHSDQVPDLVPDETEYRRTIDWLIRLKRSSSVVAVSLPYLRLLRQWPRYPRALHCQAGRFSCNVMPDGDLVACTPVPPPVRLQGPTLGFGEAFRRLGVPRCDGCFMNCYHEPNFIVGLRPDAVWNSVRFMRSRRTG